MLNALYSAKHGRVIGWRFKTFIEVAHRVEPAHRRYLHYFRRALAAYDRADQLRAEDKSGKWALKVKHRAGPGNSDSWISDSLASPTAA